MIHNNNLSKNDQILILSKNIPTNRRDGRANGFNERKKQKLKRGEMVAEILILKIDSQNCKS